MADVQLVITLTEKGGINVNGPLHDKLLTYGLLEMGRVSLDEHYRRAAEVASMAPRIVVPDGPLPPTTGQRR